MKVKKWTITKDQLNSGSYTELSLLYVDSNRSYNYPKGIQLVNESNCTVGYLYLSEDEISESGTNPSYYEYLTLPSGNSTSTLPAATRVRFKKLSGTATEDLIIYTFNYQSSYVGS